MRQGCVLSSLLFNLYSEAVSREALGDEEIGIKVNTVWIYNIRYADDTMLIADNMQDLLLLVIIGEPSRLVGLNISSKKAKFMIIKRKLNVFEESQTTFNPIRIDKVNKFIYLSVWLSESWSSDIEIK